MVVELTTKLLPAELVPKLETLATAAPLMIWMGGGVTRSQSPDDKGPE